MTITIQDRIAFGGDPPTTIVVFGGTQACGRIRVTISCSSMPQEVATDPISGDWSLGFPNDKHCKSEDALTVEAVCLQTGQAADPKVFENLNCVTTPPTTPTPTPTPTTTTTSTPTPTPTTTTTSTPTPTPTTTTTSTPTPPSSSSCNIWCVILGIIFIAIPIGAYISAVAHCLLSGPNIVIATAIIAAAMGVYIWLCGRCCLWGILLLGAALGVIGTIIASIWLGFPACWLQGLIALVGYVALGLGIKKDCE